MKHILAGIVLSVIVQSMYGFDLNDYEFVKTESGSDKYFGLYNVFSLQKIASHDGILPLFFTDGGDLFSVIQSHMSLYDINMILTAKFQQFPGCINEAEFWRSFMLCIYYKVAGEHIEIKRSGNNQMVVTAPFREIGNFRPGTKFTEEILIKLVGEKIESVTIVMK